MAWIQIDTDLESKQEYLRLLDLTGATKAELTRRIFHLWAWIDGATDDGFFDGLTAASLANRFEGTTAEFWQCFSDKSVQWLEFTSEGIVIPGYEKRFSQSAKRRASDAKRKSSANIPQKLRTTAEKIPQGCGGIAELDRETEKETDISVQSSVSPVDGNGSERGKTWSQASHDVELDVVAEVAEELFLQADYRGDDGGIFWQAAAVLHAVPGTLNRAKLVEAARDSRKARKSKPACFRGALRNMCPDFEERLKIVWIEPMWPKLAPNRLARSQVAELILRRPPSDTSTETARRKALNDLERMESK